MTQPSNPFTRWPTETLEEARRSTCAALDSAHMLDRCFAHRDRADLASINAVIARRIYRAGRVQRGEIA